MRSKDSIQLFIVLGLITFLIAGCSSGNKEHPEARTTLKVMYYDENGFNYQYGMLFSALYPDIDVEVISWNNIKPKDGKDLNEAIFEFIDEKKPDVLMLNAKQYSQMSREGKLLNLEALMARDKFDPDGIVPGIVEYIREQSDGKLYGLAPSFYSKAVYYNKDLFVKHGIPFPEDRMSWDSLLQLADRFPTNGTEEDRIYGLRSSKYANDLYSFGTTIGSTMGLDVFNAASKQMTINSESWKQVFETAQKAIQSPTMFIDDNQFANSYVDYESFVFQDPFIRGKIAMVVDDNYLMSQIKESQKSNAEKAIKSWDLVTMPVNSQNPGVTSSTSVDQILAIDANSANIEAAWKFLSYINGNEFARVKAKSNMGSLPVRTKYIKDEEGHNLQAFYSLKPIESSVYQNYDKIPNETFGKIMELTQQQLKKVTDEELSVSEALDYIQVSGQHLLDAK